MNIIKKTKQYYEKLNAKNGVRSPNNLWCNEERQIVRFQKSMEIFDFANKEILDVGCGYGDFYNYLLKKAILPKSYTGIDLLQQHCDIAKEKLPESCKIVCGDFLQIDADRADLIILSGTLNYYDEEWFSFAHQIIDKMWLLAKVGILFNMRSPKSMHSNSELPYKQYKDLSPSYWCSYAESMTSKYALFHDYVDYDYTIAMWKEKPHE